MPRAQVNPSLVRRPEESERNLAWLKQTCVALEPRVLETVRTAMVRDAASFEAKPWLESAHGVLEKLFELRAEHAGPAKTEEAKLVAAIQRDLPPLSEAEVREHTRRVVAVMVTSWVDTLRVLVQQRGSVPLNELLLPEKKFDERAWNTLLATLKPFAVTTDDAPAIMIELREQLFRKSDQATLPFDIRIARRPRGGFVAELAPASRR